MGPTAGAEEGAAAAEDAGAAAAGAAGAVTEGAADAHTAAASSARIRRARRPRRRREKPFLLSALFVCYTLCYMLQGDARPARAPLVTHGRLCSVACRVVFSHPCLVVPMPAA